MLDIEIEDSLDNNKWQDLKQQTDFVIDSCKAVAGKVIVPFFSHTGAGKSFTINLLSHCKLITRYDDCGMEVLDFQDAKTKVGLSMNSETSVPICVDSLCGEYTMLDCPGFFDTRGDLSRLLVTLSIRHSIQQAKTIKGVVIMLDFCDLRERSSNFTEMASLFGTLLKDNFPEKSFIVIVSNKYKKQIEKHSIEKAIEGNLKVAQSRWTKLSQNYSLFKKLDLSVYDNEKEANGLKFLSLLYQNLDRVFLLDVHQQDCISMINEAIKNLQPASKDQFQTYAFDRTWNNFNSAINNIASETITFFENYVTLKGLTIQSQSTIAEMKTRLTTYSKRLQKLQAAHYEIQSEQLDIMLDQLKTEKEKEIEKLEKERFETDLILLDLEKEIKKNQEKQIEYDSNAEVVVYNVEISEKRNSVFGMLSWTSKILEFGSNCCPYREEETITTGKLTELNNHSDGHYHKYYTTNWGEDANMKVVLYAKKKDLATNKLLSKRNLAELKKIFSKKDATQDCKHLIENNIRERGFELEGINLGISGAQEKMKAFSVEADSITKSMQDFEALKEKAQQNLHHLSKSLMDEEFKRSIIEERVNGIENIFQLFGIDEKLVNYYKESKARFLNTGTEVLMVDNVDGLERIICPISCNIMLDPVILPCCNQTVDRVSLYQFVTNEISACPFCRTNFAINRVLKNKVVSDLVETYRKTSDDQLPISYLERKADHDLCDMEMKLKNRIQDLQLQLETESKKLERILGVKESRIKAESNE